MVILQFAGRSFHTKKLYSRLYSTEIELSPQNNKNCLFEPLFGGLRGNVRTPSIARWKASGDFLFIVIERFRYLLRLRRYNQKSVEVGVFRRGGPVTLSLFLGGRSRRQSTTVGIRKLE